MNSKPRIMKKIITTLLLSCTGYSAHAQFLNEVQLLDGKMYVELSNPEGIPVSSVKITLEYSDTVVHATQKEIDSLSKKGSFVVMTFPQVKGKIDYSSDDDQAVNAIINDTITTTLNWYCICAICNGYSLSRMYYDLYNAEGPDIYGYEQRRENTNQYTRIISRPTIGKPNVRDSVLANRRGRLLRKDKTPYCNVSFVSPQYFNLDGTDTLKTNADGYFSIYSWPAISGKGCRLGRCEYSGLEIYDGSFDSFYLSSYRRLFPGINNEDLFDIGITRTDTVSAASLTLSPNPAKGSVAVGYEMPAGADYRSCSIVLVGSDGRIARTEPLQSASGTQAVQLGGIPRGQYSCILRTAEGAVIGKENLIVE